VRLNRAFCLSALLLTSTLPAGLGAQEETVIFLVRHAERADDGPAGSQMAMDPQMKEDPPLSEAGQTRALLLAEMLEDVGITHIHSTNYVRTRKTAQPSAEAAGVQVTLYDAADLQAFAARLRATPGRHLVIGHSNTTPELVEALGGDPGSPMESLEYNRLYMVSLEGGMVRTILLRFGEAFYDSGGWKP